MNDLNILLSLLNNGENYTIDGITTYRPPTKLNIRAAKVIQQLAETGTKDRELLFNFSKVNESLLAEVVQLRERLKDAEKIISAGTSSDTPTDVPEQPIEASPASESNTEGSGVSS